VRILEEIRSASNNREFLRPRTRLRKIRDIELVVLVERTDSLGVNEIARILGGLHRADEAALNESRFQRAITLSLAITLYFPVRPAQSGSFKTRAFTALAYSLDLYRL